MKIKMQLLSDAVFGSGMSVPGGEDIAVQCDEHGFPYYKGSTFKGVFREELVRYLNWTGGDLKLAEEQADRLLGKPGSICLDEKDKLVFSDFRLSRAVQANILAEIGESNSGEVLDCLTNRRTFTAIAENGIVREGTLRYCRCVNKGLIFYSEIECRPEDEKVVADVLPLIKWIGTMRNRGFGKVKISVEGGTV